MSEYVLEMTGVSKSFPGVKALDNVQLRLRPGKVHALMGENGAGKSTLMKCMFGIYKMDEGQILMDGEPVTISDPMDALKKGIAMVHQELQPIPARTVGENIFLGRYPMKKVLGFIPMVDHAKMYADTEELLKKVRMHFDPKQKVGELSVSQMQSVEIAKAVSANCRVLILDEPTSSLNDEDARMLLDLLMEFKKQGLTSIIITHKLNEIIYCADKATILRDGTTIETLVKGVDDFSEDRIIKGMVGRPMDDRFPARTHRVEDEVSLEVKDWTVHHPLYPEKVVVNKACFKVHKGEVVGFSGLQGAGRTELAMSIFGRSYGTDISGKLFIHGKETHLKNPEAAIHAGLAYVTEDRKTNGLLLNESIRFNTTLSRLDKVCDHGIVDRDKEKIAAERMKEEMGTKTPSVEQKVGNLSGGNQQKALLGKWMFTEPDILILDEPTRGIDVGAKYDIYCLINQMVDQGKSVVMISSEMPELLGMCDRIYVMNEGNLLAELDAAQATQEVIMGYILRDGR